MKKTTMRARASVLTAAGVGILANSSAKMRTNYMWYEICHTIRCIATLAFIAYIAYGFYLLITASAR